MSTQGHNLKEAMVALLQQMNNYMYREVHAGNWNMQRVPVGIDKSIWREDYLTRVSQYFTSSLKKYFCCYSLNHCSVFKSF